jgi:TM2 domain-containing membrane protein YozV
MKGPHEKYCYEYGEIIRTKAEICRKCGVRQPIIQGMPQGRIRIVAALYAILLGWLGIHKFYLGRMGWGIVYLAFSVTFIPAIVGVIEGIGYLTMTDEAFNATYNMDAS